MACTRRWTERNWDVITFQQASHDSGIAESYYPYLPELLAYAPQPLPAMRDTCCIKPGHHEIDSTHEAFARYGRSQARMYAQLCDAYSARRKTHRPGTDTFGRRSAGAQDASPNLITPQADVRCAGMAFTWT